MTFSKQGELVQFLSAGDAKINSCKVYFSPKQAGTGDPSPENVREISGYNGVEVYHCGKNLLNENLFTNTGYIRGTDGYKVSNDSFRYTQLIPIVAGNYYFSGIDTNVNSGVASIHAYDENGKWITRIANQTKSIGVSYSFPFTITNEIKYIRVSAPILSNAQIELGSTATKFEPYETRISDVLPKEYQEVEYIESTGTQYFWSDIDIQDGLTVDSVQTLAKGSDSYLFGGLGDSNTNSKTCFNGGYGGHVQGAYPTSYYTFGTITFDNQTKYHIIATHANNRRIGIIDGVEIANLGTVAFDTAIGKCLCFGWNKVGTPANFYKGKVYSLKVSKASELLANYIPCYRRSDKVAGMYDTVTKSFYTNQGTGEFLIGPKINGYDIDWSSEVGTVYGGYVDLVSGELVDEWKYLEFNGTETWTRNSGTQYSTDGSYRFETSVPKSYWADTNKPIEYGMANYLKPRNTGGLYYEYPNNFGIYQTRYYVRISSISEVADLKTYLASNVLQTTYKLATPITHQLTPSQLTTLTNQNTFWSNADRIEIEYDLIETRQIEMARRNIIMNSPHVESVTGSNASFITDVVSNLKECKIHFTPIQEGSGDPSPDNVRPISGHNGVTVYKTGKNLVDVEDMKSTYPWSSATYKSYALYVGADKEVTVSFKSLPEVGKNFYFGISGSTSNSSLMTWMYHKTVSSYSKRIRAVTTNSKGYLYITLYARNTEGLNDFYEYILDNDFQVEFGSEATDYEPYTAQSLTIPFPQTIYGGYVDLVKGEVVETDVKYASTGTEKWANDGANYYLNYNLGGNCKTGTRFNPMCSHLDDGNAWISVNGKLNVKRSSVSSVVSDLDGYKSWLVSNYENGTPLSVVYPLATPITYPLDPVTIRTLKGQNNIFSSANGNIEISYWTH